jgi:hypothetical protein
MVEIAYPLNKTGYTRLQGNERRDLNINKKLKHTDFIWRYGLQLIARWIQIPARREHSLAVNGAQIDDTWVRKAERESTIENTNKFIFVK